MNTLPGVMNCSPGFFVDGKDMKKSLVFFSAIFCACLMTSVCAAGEPASGDEPISLNVEQKPLGDVLAMITKTTGHAFIIDAQWLDMPVSISVKATPLHKALKAIFSDLSNAIIYQADGKIKILLYGETAQNNKGPVSEPAAPEPEGASSPETEQEPDTALEAVPEAETDNSSDTANEGETQPGEEQESAEEQTENPAEATAEEQPESKEGVTD